jgi:hypothetical protein
VSIELATHYGQQYATNVDILLQRAGSQLRPYVTFKGGYKGKQVSLVDQVGEVSARRVTSRFVPIERTDINTDRRWVLPYDYDLAQQVDHFDQLRMLSDPKSAMVQAAMKAMGRAEDDLIVDAFFGDAKTGETGSGTTSFPSGNQVAVNFESASNVGLTVAKLREARRLAKANHLQWAQEQMFCAITSGEDSDLLKEIQIINLDYNDRPVLKDGKIERFLGINFVDFEALDTDGSSYNRVPVWAKSGMHLAQWEEFNTTISQRTDLRGHPWQAYILGTFGAARVEEDKVYEIKCN